MSEIRPETYVGIQLMDPVKAACMIRAAAEFGGEFEVVEMPAKTVEEAIVTAELSLMYEAALMFGFDDEPSAPRESAEVRGKRWHAERFSKIPVSITAHRIGTGALYSRTKELMAEGTQQAE